MKSSITALAIAVAVLAPKAQASLTCNITVPSDLSKPMNYDKVLWEGTFHPDGLRFLVAKDLSVATPINARQAWDKDFLAKHNGEFAIVIARPYPGDQEPGDIELGQSTIDVTQEFYRTARILTVANISLKPNSYGVLLNDLSRHISVGCR